MALRDRILYTHEIRDLGISLPSYIPNGSYVTYFGEYRNSFDFFLPNTDLRIEEYIIDFEWYRWGSKQTVKYTIDEKSAYSILRYLDCE